MEETEKQQLVEKAHRLEAKQLFVKAADYYLKVDMGFEAASAYEKAMAFEKAESLFRKLGKNEDAERCKAKREKASGEAGRTWQDLQSEFQKDKGNPY